MFSPNFRYFFRGIPTPSLEDFLADRIDVQYLTLAQWAEEALDQTKRSLDSDSQSFPPYNATQQEDGSLHIEFAIAGYRKEDITLSFEGDVLILKAPKGSSREEASGRLIKKALKLSKFEATYRLAPDRFDTSQATAKFEDGMLVVTLPLSESKVPKKVTIQ